MLDVGFASAIAMVLLVACIVISVAYTRIIHVQGGRSGEHDASSPKEALTPFGRLTAVYAAIVLVFLVLPTSC